MVKGASITFCSCAGFELSEASYLFSHLSIDLNGLALEVLIKITKVCFVLTQETHKVYFEKHNLIFKTYVWSWL